MRAGWARKLRPVNTSSMQEYSKYPDYFVFTAGYGCLALLGLRVTIKKCTNVAVLQCTCYYDRFRVRSYYHLVACGRGVG